MKLVMLKLAVKPTDYDTFSFSAGVMVAHELLVLRVRVRILGGELFLPDFKVVYRMSDKKNFKGYKEL